MLYFDKIHATIRLRLNTKQANLNVADVKLYT